MARLIGTMIALGMLASCDQAANPTPAPNYEDAATGKADGTQNVEIIPANEQLLSTSLRRMLCAEITEVATMTNADRTAFESDCLDHSFTITEFTRSTIIAHLDDGDAITLAMRVDVDSDQGAFETELLREWQGTSFAWTAKVAEGTAGAGRQFVQQLADDMGEYFWPDERPDNLVRLDQDDVPAQIVTLAEERLQDIDRDFEDPDRAVIDGEGPWWRIVDDFGNEVGFVVEIQYWINHPLFDGGGTTLYYDVTGHLVEEVEFWG